MNNRKLFKFNCKQNQEDLVLKVLGDNYGSNNLSCDLLSDPSDRCYISVSCLLPNGVSKRSADRLLFKNKVAGSYSKENKYKIVKIDGCWDALGKVGVGNIFIASEKGKLSKAVVAYRSYGCDCCGGYCELEYL